MIVDQRVGALKKMGRLWLTSFKRENVLWKKSTNEVLVDVEHIAKHKHAYESGAILFITTKGVCGSGG